VTHFGEEFVLDRSCLISPISPAVSTQTVAPEAVSPSPRRDGVGGDRACSAAAPQSPGLSPRPEQIQDFWQRLMQLNWRPLLDELSDRGGPYRWPWERAVAALADYHQFLLLHFLWPEESFAVSVDVDTVWHVHILDTRRYGPDCQWLFGYFLHHVPRIGRQGDGDRLEYHRRQAVQRLRDRADLWPRPPQAAQNQPAQNQLDLDPIAAAPVAAAPHLLRGDWAATACILSRSA
jgi:hypothetical protein